MRFRKELLVITSLTIFLSLLAIAVWGLKPAIDFTGGSLLELEFVSDKPAETVVREVVTEVVGSEPAVIQTTDENRLFIKLSTISQQQATQIESKLAEITGNAVNELRFETIGPTLGSELLRKTIIAVVLASLFITGYVAWVFKNVTYGISAIVAMIHDTVVLLGVFALLGKLYGVEVDSLFVTAVLTTLSFSIHDTVVVYDRIRESKRKYPRATILNIANKSITETLPRSLNNSMTIVFMLTALLILGGVTIKWMAAALLLGTVLGTLSSPFLSVPLLVVLEERNLKKKSQRR